ncbi:MAG TPA: hypothetical protein VMN04_12920 [Thermoanaerobaculia bacterium]|nr:hypothetical protein [Thermoanaerobaculia bacterium]
MNHPPEAKLTDPYDAMVWFGPEVVAPGELVVLQMILPRHFAGKKLVIPSKVGASFSIHDIVVAGQGQTQAQNPIPAAAFSERAVGVKLGLETNVPGSSLDLIVSNTSTEPKIFVAFIEGTEWIGDPANKFREVELNGQKYKIDENPVATATVVHRRAA